MLIEELTHTVPLPEGVNANYDGETLVIDGPRGQLKRSFSHPQLGIQPSDSAVVVSGKKLRKRQQRQQLLRRRRLMIKEGAHEMINEGV